MRDYLQKGYELNKGGDSSYVIDSVIGEGGSCIAYRAIKRGSIHKPVVIKEFYPISIRLKRDNKNNLVSMDEDSKRFKESCSSFERSLDEQILVRNHPKTKNQTLSIDEIINENNTVYVVSPEFSGWDYSNNEIMSLYDRIRVCRSVTRYVASLHEEGYLCLDIKPDNILVLPETPEFAMFYDFDSVRRTEEIRNGIRSMYTESWAAPEQLIPSKFQSISEATDIYILGELVFWSLFDRHSKDEEHRWFTPFDFNESQYYVILSNKAKSIFTDFFHHTIISSIKGRYESANCLLVELDKIIDELYPKKESLISGEIPKNNIPLIGRKRETREIEECLSLNHMAFLIGVGGIGKSAVARDYLHSVKVKYNNIIVFLFQYNLIYTISNKQFISNYEKAEGETDWHFCERKINKMAELCDEKTLVVFDNLFLSMDNEDEKRIWQRIITLPCDLLVTTRQARDEYIENVIMVEPLSEEDLEQLYKYNSSFDECFRNNVRNIIAAVGKHTLAVELISKQAKVAHLNPEEMQTQLENRGVLGFNRDRINHEWNNKSVAEHIRKLFDTSNLSAQQKRIMYGMSFSTEKGIGYKAFTIFYDLEDHNDLQYLAQNGWIEETEENEARIIIHPVISEVVLSELKEDTLLADLFYMDARETMSFFMDYVYSSKTEWGGSDITEFFLICEAIAKKTVEKAINTHGAADYLIEFDKNYSNKVDSESRMLRAIEIYNCFYDSDDYAFVREYALYRLVRIHFENQRFIEHKRLCEQHMNMAKKKNDYIMEALWCCEMQCINLSIKLTKRLYDLLSIIKREAEDKQFHQFRKKMDRLNYGYYSEHIQDRDDVIKMILQNYVEAFERSLEDVFFWKTQKHRLKGFVRFRRTIFTTEDIEDENGRIVIFDNAKLDIVRNNYSAAKEKLEMLKKYYKDNQIPTTKMILDVHYYLGTIALGSEDHEKAAEEYRKCITLNVKGKWGSNYKSRIGLARSLVFMGKMNEAEQINRQLIAELINYEGYDSSLLLAETYYNIGCKFALMNDYKAAGEYMDKALGIFRISGDKTWWANDGIIRCGIIKAELLIDYDKKAAKRKVRLLRRIINSCALFGYRNPLVQRQYRQLLSKLN